MFPNVRWLFAAMLASILVLCGGLGLFASLRVRHEPLTHLSTSAGPPQSFADNVEATPAFTAPFQSRFPADSNPTVVVAADPQPPRIDRDEAPAPIETAAPAEPPPTQLEVKADAAAPAQPADVSDGAKPLDLASDSAKPIDLASDSAKPLDLAPGNPASDTTPAPTPESAPAEVAAIEPPGSDTTGAIDPAAVVPLPRAAPPQTSAKAKAPRPQPIAKRAVRQRVAARTRHARRPRARDTGVATAAAFPGQPFQNSPFQNSPFQNSPFQNPAPAAQNTRAQRRAGGGAPMGGPFVPAPGIDPY